VGRENDLTAHGYWCRHAGRQPGAVVKREPQQQAESGLCIDEGALSFVTEMCCSYMDFLHKIE
jgi:hypothetical protein